MERRRHELSYNDSVGGGGKKTVRLSFFFFFLKNNFKHDYHVNENHCITAMIITYVFLERPDSRIDYGGLFRNNCNYILIFIVAVAY